jgi:hypothetical protein
MAENEAKSEIEKKTDTPAPAPVAASPRMQEYHFPQHGKTVTAPSLEEATKKVTDLVKNKK